MRSAKHFRHGRSQAVRLPKEFRFDGVTEVYIAREGDRVVLSAGRRAPSENLIKALAKFEHSPDRDQATAPDERAAF